MQLNEMEIQSIVQKVVDRLSVDQRRDKIDSHKPMSNRHQAGVFDDLKAAVRAAENAQQHLLSLSLAHRKKLIEAVRALCREYVRELSELAVSETALGRVDDKVRKNHLIIDKTPGPEILEPVTYTGDDGLTLHEMGPVRIIAAITPSTNPTETVICNAIGMISAENSVVFNPHPLAKRVSARAVELINEAIVAAGGPLNVASCIRQPTIESAQTLMRDPKVRMVVVTGGPGVVAEAMRCGKKVIAAGPGNPPVVVDETANLEEAGKGIVLGASLDNNIVCTAEKEILAVDAVVEPLKKSICRNGAYELTDHQRNKLEEIILKDGRPNKEWIGKDAHRILSKLGIAVGPEIRLITCEAPKDHAFVQQELLMPVIPIVRMKDVQHAIAFAKEIEHGFRHTAVMYSRNIDHLHHMARTIDTTIFVKNAPNYAGLGLGGEGYASFTIAGPTGEGMTNARHFSRQRRCTLAGKFRIV